jgi:hypothetical protein
MFAGERPASLAAVRHHLDTARQAAVTPIAASHYAAIADGFFSTQMTALDQSSWLIQNRGALQTVRFDDAAGLAVDFSRSVGVVGERRQGGSLYVALDEAHTEVILALRPANDVDEVGADGRLALTADADAMNPIEIEVACAETDR